MRRAKDAGSGATGGHSGGHAGRRAGSALEDVAAKPRRKAGAHRKPAAAASTGRRERAAPTEPPKRARAAAAPKPTTSSTRTPPREPKRVTTPPRAEVHPRVEKPTPPTTPARPEEYLYRALGAKTARARGMWARRGLSSRGLLDRTTQSMLLRQLYLAYFEERRFAKALEVAEQIVGLGILPDVAHQDAARAAQALGETEQAAGHLRLAARIGPPKRKAFHWWTLGSLYFLAHRYEDALGAMTRAARWGTTDRPLYQGHVAVIRCAAGEAVDDLGEVAKRLAAVPAGQGYGRFVLGQLAFYGRRWDAARRYLEAFVRRTLSGRTAMAIALDGELAVARELLGRLGATS